MKIVGNAISMLGLYLIYSVSFGSQARYSYSGIDWSSALPLMIIGAGIAALGGYVSQVGLEHKQQELSLSGRLEALYLRPFDLDSMFLVARQSNLFDWDKYDRPGIDGWERVLADALSKTAMLRGLGIPGEVTLGPRLEGFAENWQNEISQSLIRSDYVFVIPSANKSTLWELRQIRDENLFSKTIFIMPPICYPFEYKGSAPFTEVWLKTVEACRSELNLDLPTYNEMGALFRFQEGRIRIQALSDYTPKSVARAINRLLDS